MYLRITYTRYINCNTLIVNHQILQGMEVGKRALGPINSSEINGFYV